MAAEVVRRADTRGLAERANILLPGLYAWLLTVAEPATGAGVGLLARMLAFLALIALVTGPFLAPDRPVLGRVFGIYGFVGLSVLAWSQLGSAVSAEQLDPLRAALGAFGWVLYAFGWGKTRGRGRVPEDDPTSCRDRRSSAVAASPPSPGSWRASPWWALSSPRSSPGASIGPITPCLATPPPWQPGRRCSPREPLWRSPSASRASNEALAPA